jgi:hypothetical protein
MITYKEFVSKLNEDAPANAVGGGNIAGAGVGPQGEPGIRKTRPKILKRGIKWSKIKS